MGISPTHRIQLNKAAKAAFFFDLIILPSGLGTDSHYPVLLAVREIDKYD